MLQTAASKKKKKNKNKHSAQNQENSNSSQSVPAANNLAPELSLMCNGGIASTSSLVNGCHLSDPDVAVVKEQQHSRVPAHEPPSQKTKVQSTRPKEGNAYISMLNRCCFVIFSFMLEVEKNSRESNNKAMTQCSTRQGK